MCEIVRSRQIAHPEDAGPSTEGTPELERWENSETGRPEVGAAPLVARRGHGSGGGGDGRWVGACRLTRLAVATRRLPACLGEAAAQSLLGLPKRGVVTKMVSTEPRVTAGWYTGKAGRSRQLLVLLG